MLNFNRKRAMRENALEEINNEIAELRCYGQWAWDYYWHKLDADAPLRNWFADQIDFAASKLYLLENEAAQIQAVL